MTDILDVIAHLQDDWLTLSGIQNAPDLAPESPGYFPFVATYEARGNLRLGTAGWGHDFSTIFSELHVSRAILPEAIKQAGSYKKLFLQKFIDDPTLGGTVSTVKDIRYTFGKLTWGDPGVNTLGYRFEIDIKVSMP